ncbi:hypothetical protein HDV05_002115 [Chytridiales sp. JEL 0842]|nr:hypothetical protein HDV05_002115 [Chytridiales sp. JEL 0842]
MDKDAGEYVHETNDSGRRDEEERHSHIKQMHVSRNAEEILYDNFYVITPEQELLLKSADRYLPALKLNTSRFSERQVAGVCSDKFAIPRWSAVDKDIIAPLSSGDKHLLPKAVSDRHIENCKLASLGFLRSVNMSGLVEILGEVLTESEAFKSDRVRMVFDALVAADKQSLELNRLVLAKRVKDYRRELWSAVPHCKAHSSIIVSKAPISHLHGANILGDSAKTREFVSSRVQDEQFLDLLYRLSRQQ